MSILRPLKFGLNLKQVLWGGDKIGTFKGVHIDESHIGESWEVSGLRGHESVVLEGEDRGLNLRELIRKYRGDLVGKRVYRKHGDEFPLLVKIIDAKLNLSVQVHPNDDLAQERHGCNGKTEMWYIIDSDPNAKLYAGMRRTITPDVYRRMVADNTILNAVASHETHPGDIFFLPAGRIHAIGAGNLLAEIQQSSDITYRVYDFNRLDKDGKPRQLHTDLAADAIDYTIATDCKRNYVRSKGITSLINSIFFNVDRVIVEHEFDLRMPHDAFLVVMCIDGEASVTSTGGCVTPMRRGETILVPAVVRQLHFEGSATFITATV